MGRKANSKAKQRDINSKFKDHWIDIAAQRYAEVMDEVGGKGARTICREVAEECYAQTKKTIKLSRNIVQRRAKGNRSIREFNAEKKWLTNQEEDTVVDFTIETAIRGFPLNYRRLREHVDTICKAKLGERFPETGVGKEWPYRFVDRHWERLRPYWTHGLDNSRARAVNPNTKEAYFDLLKQVIEGEEDEEEIGPDCIYGMDETGLQQGVGVTERVLGPAGQKVQYQQGSGDRENITVLETICADGTSIPPAVIYKGEAFHTTWKQNNPLNAFLGYSRKGYTDGEIGLAWIQQFDSQTKAKAAGRRRLLLVDGHASHYTFAFLDYARKNCIHVLCYPSHSTHVYQGLDVVIFSVLKREWTTARGAFERRGRKVDKTNFLGVYAEAHLNALTPENIKMAFQKTGVVPFNPDVVTAAMMAPSLETSSRGHLPLPQASPVRRVAALLMREAGLIPDDPQPRDGATVGALAIPATPRTPSRVRNALTVTSASYLLSPTPVTSSSAPPTFLPTPISPLKRRHRALLEQEPSNEFEAKLLAALKEREDQCIVLKQAVVNMQATAVLQNVYLTRVQGKLEGQEEKARRPKRRKLMSDGLPKLLDGDVFFNQVVAHEEAEKAKTKAKEARKADKDKHTQAVEQWKKGEVERKNRVAAQRKAYRDGVAAWEGERDLAKAERRRPRWSKPKLGAIEKPLPKPKLSAAREDEDDEDEDEDKDEEEEDE